MPGHEANRDRLENRRRRIRAIIERVLKTAGGRGATRMEIRKALGHHVSKKEIDLERALFEQVRAATWSLDPPNKSGDKTTERWRWIG